MGLILTRDEVVGFVDAQRAAGRRIVFTNGVFDILHPGHVRLLERALRETYGITMDDLFVSEDLAVGTFRHAVASTIPNVTKVAWQKKQEQIQKTTPGAVREQFVLTLPRTAYDREYGTHYREPHGLARVLGVALCAGAEDRTAASARLQGPDAGSGEAVSRKSRAQPRLFCHGA